MCDQQRLRPACAYTQPDQSLCLSLEFSMGVMLLTEHLLEVLSLKGGYTGCSESTLVKMPHCWKSHVTAQLLYIFQSFTTLVNNALRVAAINSVGDFILFLGKIGVMAATGAVGILWFKVSLTLKGTPIICSR